MICEICKKEKPDEEYPTNYMFNPVSPYTCKQCIAMLSPETTKPATIDKALTTKRKKSVKGYLKYGLSKTQRSRFLIDRQQKRCAICNKESEELNLDHDHVLNVARGFVCQTCNMNLRAIDNLEYFKKLVKFRINPPMLEAYNNDIKELYYTKTQEFFTEIFEKLQLDESIYPDIPEVEKNDEAVESPIILFATECLEFKGDLWITKDQLFDIWKAWCVNQGRQHGFKESFCRWFINTYPQVKTERKRIDNNRIYGFSGVCITETAFNKFYG